VVVQGVLISVLIFDLCSGLFLGLCCLFSKLCSLFSPLFSGLFSLFLFPIFLISGRYFRSRTGPYIRDNSTGPYIRAYSVPGQKLPIGSTTPSQAYIDAY
jgi:hypothetical protein